MNRTLIFMSLGFFISTTCLAQMPAQTPAEAAQILQKALPHQDPQKSMGQALVASILLGCTNKKAGKEATNAFFSQMQNVGKQAETFCKQKNPAAARALLVNTIEQKRGDPVAKAAVACYYEQKDALAALAGKKSADDLAQYVRWFQTPGVAAEQIKDTDICKGKI